MVGWKALWTPLQGLPPALPLSQRLPRRYAQSPSDVFCLVKQNLSDTELMQPALLVWPGDEAQTTAEFWQKVINHRGVQTRVDDDRASDLLDLAGALGMYPQYGRAIEYIKRLAGKLPRSRMDAHPITCITAAAARPLGNASDAVLPARPTREDPHRLEVRFHRR